MYATLLLLLLESELVVEVEWWFLREKDWLRRTWDITPWLTPSWTKGVWSLTYKYCNGSLAISVTIYWEAGSDSFCKLQRWWCLTGHSCNLVLNWTAACYYYCIAAEVLLPLLFSAYCKSLVKYELLLVLFMWGIIFLEIQVFVPLRMSCGRVCPEVSWASIGLP